MRAGVVIPAFARLQSLESVLKSCRAQSAQDLEIIVVDDKSPHSGEIKKLCSYFGAQYIRNNAREIRESQRALCLNLGYQHSSADIVVFLDADILIPTRAIEKHIAYHSRPRVVVTAQIWSIGGGESAVYALKDFSEENLMQIGKWMPHADVPWSKTEALRTSDNWWALLGGQCSFKRVELDELGGWDASYSGWGVEDNDMGYRADRLGYSFVYAEDIKGFHIDHEMTRPEYIAKCSSALRNLRLFRSKYIEVARDPRVRLRVKELEDIVAGNVAVSDRQPTAGGGRISGAAK